MNRLMTLAGALFFAAFPATVQGVTSTLQTPSNVAGAEEAAPPFEVVSYMAGASQLCSNLDNPELLLLQSRLELALSARPATATPSAVVRDTLKASYPVVYQAFAGPEYITYYDEEEGLFVRVCLNKTNFLVATPEGDVAVDVTERM